MNKKALLISADLAEDPRPGIPRDLRDWSEFLRSNNGGAWNDSEIMERINPSRQDVLWAIAALEGADYAMTIFIGHGYVEDDDMGVPVTYMNLKDEEVISERELNPKAKRYLSVLDCCRKYEPLEEAINFSKAATLEERYDAVDIRQAYERAISKAEAGWVRFYAADLNQAAADKASFSNLLIKDAVSWSRNNSGMLNTLECSKRLTERFAEKNPQQTPVHDAGRRLNYFPIAVGLKN